MFVRRHYYRRVPRFSENWFATSPPLRGSVADLHTSRSPLPARTGISVYSGVELEATTVLNVSQRRGADSSDAGGADSGVNDGLTGVRVGTFSEEGGGEKT